MTPRGEMAMSKAGPAIQLMTPEIKMIFNPPPPLAFLKKPVTKKTQVTRRYTGLAKYVGEFSKKAPEAAVVYENNPERRERIKKERMEEEERRLSVEKEAYLEVFDPNGANAGRRGGGEGEKREGEDEQAFHRFKEMYLDKKRKVRREKKEKRKEAMRRCDDATMRVGLAKRFVKRLVFSNDWCFQTIAGSARSISHDACNAATCRR